MRGRDRTNFSMPQLTDDCFAHGGAMMTIAEALALFAERLRPVDGVENLALAAADGRVLAEDLFAATALPPFANSAVDGYAIRHADLDERGEMTLAVVERLQAGDQSRRSVCAGEAIRIFTGAPMPDGADTVYMQEDVRAEGGTVVLPSGLKRGANARPAGEELDAGTLALPAGRRLRPQDLALAAATGATNLKVRRRLRAAIFSTGNELAEAGSDLKPAQVYDSNRILLATLLTRLGVEVTDLGILSDDPDGLATALAGAAPGHDLVLTSGGVSTGEADHVKAAVDRVGRLDIWRFAIKPGRPLALGTIGRAAFIGLPGNPVAVWVTFTQVVRGLIAALAGETWRPPSPLPALAAFDYRKKIGRTEFVRVHLDRGANGEVHARKFGRDGAGILSSLTETDAIAILGDTVIEIAVGDPIGVVPLGLYP